MNYKQKWANGQMYINYENHLSEVVKHFKRDIRSEEVVSWIHTYIYI